ncbi:MAG: 30S ribosome-binding factor RbfA [Verrucomicrobiae bacterium]|nr:30S ribosome-binding factor RbfA [Verrucomicrobiae bacterium]
MSNRLARVSELLKRELGNALERDFEFKDVLVTIHDVDVTPDLRHAHVFVGIVGDESRRNHVMRQLEAKRGQIQSQVMKRVVLKYTPQLHFRFDDSIERGVRVVNLLDEIARDLPPDEVEDATDDPWEADDEENHEGLA